MTFFGGACGFLSVCLVDCAWCFFQSLADALKLSRWLADAEIQEVWDECEAKGARMRIMQALRSVSEGEAMYRSRYVMIEGQTGQGFVRGKHSGRWNVRFALRLNF